MRERIWLRLRTSPLLRKLYSLPIARQSMRALSYWLLPSDKVRTLKIRSGPGKGLQLELNPRWEMPLWDGRYEIAIENALLSHLDPGDVFYDVGASIGFYSLLAARAGASVFAFEPDQQNAQTFARHVALNSLSDRIKLFECAVAARNGEVQLEPAGQDRGHGNAHVIAAGDAAKGVRLVPAVTLDHFSASQPLPKLIKIDVEGSESDVFSEARSLFTQCRPMVICEIHDSANEMFIVNWLELRNYGLSWISGQNEYPKHLVAVPN